MKKNSPIKVYLLSLGCAKNQVDAEIMLGRLHEAGFQLTDEDIHADVAVVNTCGFIEDARQEAVENIRDLAWLKKQGRLKGIVVTGCLAQRWGEEAPKLLAEADAWLGTGSYDEICQAVQAVYEGKPYFSLRPNEEYDFCGERVRLSPEAWAYLKIAEGCDNRCAYCAIPSIRGGYRSRPMEGLLEEARQLAADGVRELIVVAQDITRYGEDLYGENRFCELLEGLCQIEELRWIRLHYLYPDRITEKLIGVLASQPKILRYLDIPVQHASDRMLQAMNRRGTKAELEALFARLREALPGVVLRTTVMVGFPGETNADFDELLAFIKQVRFERLGAFVFCPEEGTPAATMKGRVGEKTAKRRLERIMNEQYDIIREFNESRVGKVEEVLVEGWDTPAECWYGRSAADSPDVDGKVFFIAPRRPEEGEFVQVRIGSVMDYDVLGEMQG